MAVAVRRQEQSKKRPARRSGKKRLLCRSGLRCLAVAVGLASLMGYVGLYAKITQNGYYKAKLAGELRTAKTQNQYLRAESQMLSSPDRLAAAAISGGMLQSEQVHYVKVSSPVALAKADIGD